MHAEDLRYLRLRQMHLKLRKSSLGNIGVRSLDVIVSFESKLSNSFSSNDPLTFIACPLECWSIICPPCTVSLQATDTAGLAFGNATSDGLGFG